MFDPKHLETIEVFKWQQAELTPKEVEYLEYYDIHFSARDDISVTHCFGSKSIAGYEIATHAFLLDDAKANVFLVHGYTDHVGLFGPVIEYLLKASFNVVCFDLPGHGLSSGERIGIPSFEAYQSIIQPLIDESIETLEGKWYLAGQSTGGAICMDYTLNAEHYPFEKLLLLAPLVLPKGWSWIKTLLFTLRYFLDRVPRDYKKNSSDESFVDFVKNRDPFQSNTIKTSWVQSLYDWHNYFLHLSPTNRETLVIQGQKDCVVEWTYNLDVIRGKFTNLTEYFIPDANHHLVRESEAIRNEVFKQMVLFINKD